MTTSIRDQITDELRAAMRLWRMGVRWTIPQDYIRLHRRAALADLPRLERETDAAVAARRMVPDGWCDGMRVLEVELLDSCGEIRTFRWSDSGGGSWYERRSGAGSCLVSVPPDSARVGHI